MNRYYLPFKVLKYLSEIRNIRKKHILEVTQYPSPFPPQKTLYQYLSRDYAHCILLTTVITTIRLIYFSSVICHPSDYTSKKSRDSLASGIKWRSSCLTAVEYPKNLFITFYYAGSLYDWFHYILTLIIMSSSLIN